jgi:transcriptional regulator with XRE-family HTH domain
MSIKRRTRAGSMIKQAREARGWSQLELAIMLGYKRGNFLSMLETGASELPFEKIPLLCELLDLDPRELLREAMTSRYPNLVKYL